MRGGLSASEFAATEESAEDRSECDLSRVETTRSPRDWLFLHPRSLLQLSASTLAKRRLTSRTKKGGVIKESWKIRDEQRRGG